MDLRDLEMRDLETFRDAGEGNTNSSPATKKQSVQRKHWCFTSFKIEEVEMLRHHLDTIAEKALVGLEVCPSTGKEHLQGFFSCSGKGKRFEQLKKLLGDIHLEPCNGSEADNVKYCSKEGQVLIRKGFPEALKLITPDRPWQKKILDIISKEPDDRAVYWFWSAAGNIGKSSFCKYLVVKHSAVFIDEGKKADIMHRIAEADMDASNLVVFDVPRANGCNISYKSVKCIKNGMIFSGKYKSKSKLFNPPHVIVFANEPPDLGALSADRWHVECIDDQLLSTPEL